MRVIFSALVLIGLSISFTVEAKTTLFCKSEISKDRAEILIDKDNKKIVFWDIPSNIQKKFRIDFSIFYDKESSGGTAGDIGAFSNYSDFFNTLTINKKNLNVTFAKHAAGSGRYSSQVELEKYKCKLGSL
jgi:hypothetical protein